LGSHSNTSKSSAGDWSIKADDVYGGKMNIAGARMIADSVEEVPILKEQILQNDRADPEGTLIEKIITVWDMLPGDVDAQKAKLEVLDSIRNRLSPGVVSRLSDDEQKRVQSMRPPETLKVIEPQDLPPIVQRRFSEKNDTIGTVTYVKFKDLKLSDGHIALRISKTTDNVRLPTGKIVQTASFSSIYAEMIRSMKRDGPLASAVAFGLVTLVVLFATANRRGAFVVLIALLSGVVCMLGGAAVTDTRLHYVNFIAVPITLGIGCEYPFNVYDRTRLLGGDVSLAVRRTAGAVALCSYTTTIGYSSLLFNDFGALQSFGRLAMAGELACILAALFLVPSLVHLLSRRAAKEQLSKAHS
jgi:predicted RND superfamily exporter protein